MTFFASFECTSFCSVYMCYYYLTAVRSIFTIRCCSWDPLKVNVKVLLFIQIQVDAMK